MKKKLLMLTLVLSLLASLTACGRADQADGKPADTKKQADSNITVRIGDQPSFVLLKVAQEKGFFEDEFAKDNITIKVESFVKQGSAIVEAMASKDIDLGIVGSLPFVTANANGNKMIALCSVNYTKDGFKLIAHGDSGIKSVKDLKGKTIATKFASNEHQMLLTLLSQEGLSTDSVNVVNMSAGDGISAFQNKSVDAILQNVQTLNAALSSGGTIIADNSKTGTITNSLVGREDFVKKYPEISSRVIKVLQRAKEYTDQNEQEAIQIVAKQSGIGEEDAKVSLQSRERGIYINEDAFLGPIKQSVDFAVQQKIINKAISMDDIVDTSYYEASGVK